MDALEKRKKEFSDKEIFKKIDALFDTIPYLWWEKQKLLPYYLPYALLTWYAEDARDIKFYHISDYIRDKFLEYGIHIRFTRNNEVEIETESFSYSGKITQGK